LLSFLNIRAIVNGKEIFPLQDTKPIVIPVQENNPRIVITDGYHYTVPLKLIFNDLNTYCFKISCAINDWQLLGGFIFLVISYLAGLFTGILFLKIICFLPIVYLLLFYYLNRREFIRLIPVLN
jgi:hypothetical protein